VRPSWVHNGSPHCALRPDDRASSAGRGEVENATPGRAGRAEAEKVHGCAPTGACAGYAAIQGITEFQE
jgi:hypothetical protein